MFPAIASAHARLVGSKPGDGDVLSTAPGDVRLLFDDAVRPAGGTRAVDAAGRSVLGGPAHLLKGHDRILVVPLRPGLGRGAYTVRWSVVSNDGHVVDGVLAFGVGTGLGTVTPTLSAGGGTSPASIVLRWLFLTGVLLAGGAALGGRVLLESRRRWLETAVQGPALLLVAGGGFGLLALEPAADATRFGRITETVAIVALVGAAAALASIAVRPLAYAVTAVSLLELAAPTLSGHALDPRRLRWLVGLADFAHVAAAAFWIGGLVLLVLAGKGSLARRRFPALAAGSVVILGAASIPRAIAVFPSFASVVHTSYGRAVLVKTALLVIVLGVAWLNRRRLRELGFAGELVLLAGIVVAVAVLTTLPPPSRTEKAAAATATVVVATGHVAPPPPNAVVLGGEDDDVAIGLAAVPRGMDIEATVTALSPENLGIDGLTVTIAGRPASSCGSGCYRATVPLPAPPRRVPVSVSGGGRLPATIPFTLPARWPAPPAAALVARTGRVYRALHSLVIHERLASNATNAITTTYLVEAPDRLEYHIAGGPQAVVIGRTRWDRLPGREWVRSSQEPLRQPEPFWGSDPVTNARLLGTGRVAGRPVRIVSFFDPKLPAWFVLSVDPATGHLLDLRMTAQAHFMHHTYSGFDEPLRIVPPAQP